MDRQSSEFNDSNRSLRRSFVAIHERSSPTIDDDRRRCYGRKDSSSSLPKSNKGSSSSLHQHKKSRGGNNRGGNRRTSMDTTSPSPLCPPPQPIHSRKPQQQQTPHRRSTYTGMTADEAQKRVAEMLNDKLTIKQQQQQEPTQRPRMVSSPNHLNKHEHSLHTSMPNLHQQTNDQQQKPTRQLGYRPDYKLGQTVRSTSHIRIPTSSQNAMQQVSTLMKYDFAFIKRSNGLYSYAILAYRTTNTNDNKGESLTFVMDDKGCTKMIRKKYWCEYIRLVNTDDLELEHQEQHGDNMMRLSKEGLYNPPPSYKRRVSDPHQVTTTDDMHQFSKYKKEDIDMLCQEIPIVCQEVPQDDAVDEYYTDEDDETAPLPEMIAFKPTNGNEECSLISSVSDRARRAYSAARIWRSGGGGD